MRASSPMADARSRGRDRRSARSSPPTTAKGAAAARPAGRAVDPPVPSRLERPTSERWDDRWLPTPPHAASSAFVERGLETIHPSPHRPLLSRALAGTRSARLLAPPASTRQAAAAECCQTPAHRRAGEAPPQSRAECLRRRSRWSSENDVIQSFRILRSTRRGYRRHPAARATPRARPAAGGYSSGRDPVPLFRPLPRCCRSPAAREDSHPGQRNPRSAAGHGYWYWKYLHGGAMTS